jgi:hypothetical protein
MFSATIQAAARRTAPRLARAAASEASPRIAFDTLCAKRRAVHPGSLDSVAVPIVPSTMFRLPDAATAARVAGAHSPVSGPDGFFYSRWANPTAEVAASVVAELETAAGGALVFSSGMAAITSAVLAVVKAGDHVIAPRAAYGGTVEWFDEFLTKLCVEVTYVDGPDIAQYGRAVKANTRWVATLTSETDIERVSNVSQPVCTNQPARQAPLTARDFFAPRADTILTVNVHSEHASCFFPSHTGYCTQRRSRTLPCASLTLLVSAR